MLYTTELQFKHMQNFIHPQPHTHQLFTKQNLIGFLELP